MGSTHLAPARRAFKIFFLLFIFACTSLFLFRKALIIFGVQWMLNGVVSSDGAKQIHYDQISWEGKTLCVSGFKREDSGYALSVEQIRLNWRVNWSHFRLEPDIALVHPQMVVFGDHPSSQTSALPLLLLPHERLKIRLEAELGTLHFSEEPDLVFYFSWVPGTSWESIGMLTLSYDPDLQSTPVFRAEMNLQEDHLFFSFHMREKECSHIAPLLAFLQFPWQLDQGDVEITGFGKLKSGAMLTELSCQGSARAVHLIDPVKETSLSFEQLEGEITYPSQSSQGLFWENIQAQLTLVGGEFHLLSEWKLSGVEGTCNFQPELDPELSLSGTIVTADTTIPLEIQGQGSAHADGTFWVDLVINSRPDDPHELHTYLSCCSPKQDHFICQFTCEKADVTHLNTLLQIVPQLNPQHIEWLEGDLQGKVTLTIEQKELKELNVDEFVSQRLRCILPLHTQVAAAESIKGELSLKKTPSNQWDLVQATVELTQAGINQASKINATLHAANNQWLHSSIEGYWGPLFASVTIHDPGHEHLLDFFLEGSLEPFIALSSAPLGLVNFDRLRLCQIDPFGPSSLSSPNSPNLTERRIAEADVQTRVEGTILAHELGYLCEGEVLLCGGDCKTPSPRKRDDFCDEPISFGVNFTIPQTLAALLEIRSVDVIDGWVRTEMLPESVYTPYFRMWVPEFQLSGTLSLAATFDKRRIELSVEGRQLSVEHPVFNAIGLETTGPANLSYDRSTEQMTGRLALGCGLLHSKSLDLSLSQVEGYLSFESHTVKDTAHRTWKLRGGVTQCDLPLSSQCAVSGGKCEWNYAENQWSVHNGYAKLLFPDGKTYHLQLATCETIASGKAAFDIKLLESCKEVARCQGTLTVSPLTTPDKVSFLLESDHLKFKDTLIPHLILKGHKTGTQWVIDHVQTKDLNLKTTISFQDNGIELSEIKGTWKGYCATAKAKYLYETQRLFCRIDAFQGEVNSLTEKWTGKFNTCANAQWDFATVTLSGEATCALDLKGPLAVIAKSETPARFSYSAKEGWNVQGISFQLYLPSTSQHLGALKIGTMMGTLDQIQASQSTFSLSPELVKRGIAAHLLPVALQEMNWESYLEGSGDLTIASKGFSFQGKLKDGAYGIGDHMLPLEQIVLQYDPTLFSCRFKTLLGEKPLFAKIQIDHTNAPFGIVKIVDHPQSEGIQALLKTDQGILCLEKIYGSALGLTFDLSNHSFRKTTDAIFLSGTIALNGAELAPYLPQAIQSKLTALKWGSGYAFKGDIEWSRDLRKGGQLHGEVTGTECELFGFTFQHLQAHLDATHDKIFLTNLKVEDDAGFLTIKKIDAGKHPHHDTWGFSIPHLQVKEWRPSLLKKGDQTPPLAKPFVIKNLTLSEIRGTVSDLMTWEGNGTMNFTNAFKKETTLLDLPMELVKKFGLDPGLLTPIQGEVDVELRGDKFYLLNLKNAFSEGKRSQFFFSPENEISYIGLDGKLSIDLKMRQDVVLKLTEAFTLKVRGSVDRPRYGLQY